MASSALFFCCFHHLILLFVLSNTFARVSSLATREATDIQFAVQNLINRVLNRAKVEFTFTPKLEIISKVDKGIEEYFEIDGDASNGLIIFRATSSVALASAFGHYLRYYLGCDFHWENAGGYSFDSFPKKAIDLVVPKEVKNFFVSIILILDVS